MVNLARMSLSTGFSWVGGGGLQYLTITWPNISYAVNQESQYLQAPTIHHWSLSNGPFDMWKALWPLVLLFLVLPIHPFRATRMGIGLVVWKPVVPRMSIPYFLEETWSFRVPRNNLLLPILAVSLSTRLWQTLLPKSFRLTSSYVNYMLYHWINLRYFVTTAMDSFSLKVLSLTNRKHI